MTHERSNLEGSVDFVGLVGDDRFSPETGVAILFSRAPNPELAADPRLPDDTRLWAALQAASGGTWRGSIYDVDRIIEVLNAGQIYMNQLNQTNEGQA